MKPNAARLLIVAFVPEQGWTTAAGVAGALSRTAGALVDLGEVRRGLDACAAAGSVRRTLPARGDARYTRAS